MISRTRNIGGVLPMKIVPIGDWVGAQLLISDMSLLIAEGSRIGQKSAANKLKRDIRRNIKNQGVPGNKPWPPLKEPYKTHKARAGYNPDKVLYRTGLYYRSIKVWNKGENYYVGVERGIPASNGRHTVGWVAHLLERGSSARNIEPRPLWVPTYKNFGGGKRIKKIVAYHIAKLIFVRHGVRAKLY